MALTQVSKDVLNNSQANITQVGTLANLTVTGNISSANYNYANGVGILESVNSSISTLTANAGVQAGLITDTNTAITTANTAMKGYVDAINSTLTANAGAQAGSISTLETSKANLSGAAFTGNISTTANLTVSGSAGIGLIPSESALLKIAAGSSTRAPLELAFGTLMTSPADGVIEYDGKVFYSAPLGNRRGISPSEYFYRLNSGFTGANATGAQSMFGVGITLAASTEYEFEIYAVLLRTAGPNSHTISTLFGGTATFNNILYSARNSGNANNVVPYTVQLMSESTTNSTAALVVRAATATLRVETIIINGTVSINAGGTFIPQYQLSAAPGGAYVTQIGSYIKIKPIGAAGSTTNVGGFA